MAIRYMQMAKEPYPFEALHLLSRQGFAA